MAIEDPLLAEAYELGYRAGQLAMRERAASIPDEWAHSTSCKWDYQHDWDPCCHVRLGVTIAARVRALEPGEPK